MTQLSSSDKDFFKYSRRVVGNYVLTFGYQRIASVAYGLKRTRVEHVSVTPCDRSHYFTANFVDKLTSKRSVLGEDAISVLRTLRQECL